VLLLHILAATGDLDDTGIRPGPELLADGSLLLDQAGSPATQHIHDASPDDAG